MSECLNEPWETTTKYGRADLTIHPIMREAYKVACLIERCGASEDLTRASSAAFELCERLYDVLKRRSHQLSASERLHNICDALAAHADESPFTREEWDRIDAENVRLHSITASLLAALKEARQYVMLYSPSGRPFDFPKEPIDHIDAAIARAEGRSDE